MSNRPLPPNLKLPAELEAALARGEKIGALRLVRALLEAGLKQAAQKVESASATAASKPQFPSKPQAQPAPGNTLEQAVKQAEEGLSPGEVPRRIGLGWLAWVVGLAALLAWFYLRRGA
jgi:hypothetical protein